MRRTAAMLYALFDFEATTPPHLLRIIAILQPIWVRRSAMAADCNLAKCDTLQYNFGGVGGKLES